MALMTSESFWSSSSGRTMVQLPGLGIHSCLIRKETRVLPLIGGAFAGQHPAPYLHRAQICSLPLPPPLESWQSPTRCRGPWTIRCLLQRPLRHGSTCRNLCRTPQVQQGNQSNATCSSCRLDSTFVHTSSFLAHSWSTPSTSTIARLPSTASSSYYTGGSASHLKVHSPGIESGCLRLDRLRSPPAYPHRRRGMRDRRRAK